MLYRRVGNLEQALHLYNEALAFNSSPDVDEVRAKIAYSLIVCSIKSKNLLQARRIFQTMETFAGTSHFSTLCAKAKALLDRFPEHE